MEKLNTIQKRKNLNTVYRDGEPGPGGAHHDYVVSFGGGLPESDADGLHIRFQCGPRKDPEAQKACKLFCALFLTLPINRSEEDIVCMIFDYYMAGASLGKVVDMLQAKQVPSPTGKAKWTRAAVDHLLSNDKYIAIIGLEKFLDAQFEKSARCNVDYDKESAPRKETRYVSPVMVQM